ncbi:unnamed protein product, partial [Amoebophrya sp. A120]|eukprot:GSA120T00005934001.1
MSLPPPQPGPGSLHTTTWIGVYKHGLRLACLYELELFKAEIVCENLVHDLIVFRLPVHQVVHDHPENETTVEDLPLTFDLLFEPIATAGLLGRSCDGVESCDRSARINPNVVEVPQHQEKEHFSRENSGRTGIIPFPAQSFFKEEQHSFPAIEHRVGNNKKFPQRKKVESDAAKEAAKTKILKPFILEHRENLLRILNQRKPWRATCEKVGEFAVKSIDLCSLFGELATELLPERTEEEKKSSPVSMKDFELEIVIFVSHKRGDEFSKEIPGARRAA